MGDYFNESAVKLCLFLWWSSKRSFGVTADTLAPKETPFLFIRLALMRVLYERANKISVTVASELQTVFTMFGDRGLTYEIPHAVLPTSGQRNAFKHLSVYKEPAKRVMSC